MIELLLSCLMLRPLATQNSFTLSTLRSEIRAIENPVTIIDIGTHKGEFLPKIKWAFKQMGFKNIEVIGIDDFSFLNGRSGDKGKDGSQSEEMFYQHFKEEYEKQGIEYYRADMLSAHAWLHRADFSFLNAPWPDKVLDYLKASLLLTKHDGMIFLRLYKGDDQVLLRKKIFEWLEKQNLKVVEHSMVIPEGSFWLSEDVIVISRREFPGLTQYDGTNFEDLVMGYFSRSEIRRST